MRVFLAVELPQATREALANLQRQLAATGADVKWATAEQLHVTMKFLGEITEAQRQAVERLSRSAAAATAPIRLRVSSVGAFPSLTAPRVVWAGIEEGKDELARLAQRLEEALSAEAFTGEARDFVAHVTLGRVRSPRRRQELSRRLADVRWDPPAPFVTYQLTLFQSVLSPSGPIYTAIKKFPFTPDYFQKMAGMLGTGGKVLKALLEERAKDREREDR